uniref:non-specific serine/threonine protein kinase n=1 Tax=Oryza rufipogon TaxID=4529 RepID=A0A0E0NA29_ORYRU
MEFCFGEKRRLGSQVGGASSTGSCTDQEKSFLLQFLAGLSEDGGLAVSWQNDTDCCTWEGITCGTDATITEISLASKGLEGQISPYLANLTGLLHLNLSHNSLSGELPLEELVSSSSIVILDVSFNHLSGALKELSAHTTIRPLQVLNISSNLFAGQFPSTTWKVMNNLVALNASNNSFVGQILSSLCINAPSFAVLDLSFNQFGGSIPLDISNCSMLRVLKGGHNNFHGALPDELFNASSLEYLSFPDNFLNGVLDDANIIKLSKLSILDLEQNMFSGKIPKSIGQLKRLKELRLGENKLYGELPSTLGNCTNLKILDLKFNNLSGDLGKIDFSSLSNLTTIDLLVNNFSGTVPESIYACTNLIVLRIARNNFHGEFSQTMNRLRSLVFLSVADNAFTNIRTALHIFKTFRNLKMLLIGGNFKNEVLPEDETIDGFENLQHLSISGSSLYGKMPVWLSKLTNLEKLHLYDNQLTGSVPLKALDMLDLSYNSFSGEIPQAICKLTDLEMLDLSNNNLTGTIPLQLSKLHFLSAFNVSNNDLEGPIPTGGQFDTFDNSSFDGNPKLCGPMISRQCNSAKAIPTPAFYTDNFSVNIFGITVGLFFALGVLLDQMLLSRLGSSSNYNKLTMPTLCLVLALILFSASSISCCTDHERNCLLQFLAGLSQDGHGGLAASWPQGTDCCSWEGITCSSSTASKAVTITDILLASKKLEGSISPALGRLPGLQRLNLSHNSLSGGLPAEIMSSDSIVILDISFNLLNGDLQDSPSSSASGRRIQVINVSSNSFSGRFPSSSWEEMENLVVLNASNNSFTGPMPTFFCIRSSSFAMLDLSYNHFSGNLPPEIGNCSSLRLLKAGHNSLRGTLPDELFNVTSLEHLSFPNNGLQGVLDGAGMIKLRNLVVLDLGFNMFSGNIPDSIGKLKRLEEIHLHHNSMAGELTPAIGSCTNLKALNLGSNNFSGELGKVNFSKLSSLKSLHVSYNSFAGTIPESVYTCSNLNALQLSFNKFHGQLSFRITNLKSLTYLSLAENSFTNISNTLQILKSSRDLTTLLIGGNFRDEEISDDKTVDGFENLKVLAMENCPLFGNIPIWISKLKNLEMLFLFNNHLSGSIPVWISTLNSLFYLDLSNNSLSGEIPAELTEMPMLRSEMVTSHLDIKIFELPVYTGPSPKYFTVSDFPAVMILENNKLTGVIPTEIGQLKALLSLILGYNNLHGEIPETILDLTNLEILDLSNNHLTGTIPADLNNLNFLSALNVSNNDLQGPVPTGGHLDTFPRSSFDGNPRLCGHILDQDCDDPVMVDSPQGSSRQGGYKVIFVIAFGAFFGVGPMPRQLSSSSNRDNSRFCMPPFGQALLLLLLCFVCHAGSCTEQERESLLQFLSGLSNDGGLGVSWQNGTDCCTWEGITCSGNGAVVEVISLASRGLEGSISPSLGDLTGLLRLNLSRNSLSGGLPLELVSSSSIVVLDVSFNYLTGGLSELPSSTPDRPLQMPTSFCASAPSFAVLELSYNQFSGRIPAGLSNCSKLTLLSASYNNLTGTLPDELFDLTSLKHLCFLRNQLEGSIKGITKLKNLVTIDLGQNRLSGSIPNSIGQLKRLEKLHLAYNSMSGELPSTVGNCRNLKNMNLGGNNFSGDLGNVNFSTLRNLQSLDLMSNNFTGTVPESIYSCRNLSALQLSNNSFHGQLSEKIRNLKCLSFVSLVDISLTNITGSLQILQSCRNLTTLLIGYNFMQETMPEDDEIYGFENLRIFSLNDCSLSGKIPKWLSKLTNLEMLSLYNNQLNGAIPDWISSLNFLFHIDISNNSLSGEIPSALVEMPMLKSDNVPPKVFELPICTGYALQYRINSAFPKVLNLGINNFTGIIPNEIGQLKALQLLNLSSNRLSGEIPESIYKLTNLQVLDLSSNNLTGTIPDGLNKLHFLSAFNISNNDLEGPVPNAGQLSTFPSTSFDGNPKLCGPMLARHCGLAQTPFVSTKQNADKVVSSFVFMISFGAFFAVGSGDRRPQRSQPGGAVKTDRDHSVLSEQTTDFNHLNSKTTENYTNWEDGDLYYTN